MAENSTDVTAVTDLLSKTKVQQINEVSFAGRGLKLNKAEDGMYMLFFVWLKIIRKEAYFYSCIQLQ